MDVSAFWKDQIDNRKNLLEGFLSEYWSEKNSDLLQDQAKPLSQSIHYSLFQNGKRFRPLLTLSLAESFGVNPLRVLPWAAAIEMIHTYSLIHDDLPAMDDDDFRRGHPTNHKVYGEATALLAGDALLTEAFALLAEKYDHDPKLACRLISILAGAAGLRGMVAGQSMDLSMGSKASFADLSMIHNLKTGALIQASLTGAATVCGLVANKMQLISEFGGHLGLAFQIADDLLDFDADDPEGVNFVTVKGLEESRSWLDNVSKDAMRCLTDLQVQDDESNLLWFLVRYNMTRTQ